MWEEESVGIVGRRDYCRVRRILNVPVSRYDGMARVFSSRARLCHCYAM